MPTPSRDQVQQLTPEQQDALAKVELARFHRRERLLRQARTYGGRRWLSLVCFILSLWIAFLTVELPYADVAIAFIAIVFVLLHVHTTGINQRLDALMELLLTDGSGTGKEEESSHDRETADPSDRR